ncbi:MAG: hypothetical protein K6T16_01490 [Candidatus Pacearchaeota archaeon]|nr:hypothetical protein [Candidatus Pacearchaeota archaeon]
MDRRDFLKAIACYFGYSLVGGLSFGQVAHMDEENWMTEELRSKLRRRYGEALNPSPEGYGLSGSQRFCVDVGNERVGLNVKFEYYKGQKGVGGVLRAFVYLDEKDWYSMKGIKRLRFILYSPREMRLSRRVHEVNLNRYYGLVTHSPLEHVVLEGDYLTEKIKESVFAILKKIKVDKKDINQVIWVRNLFKDIRDNETMQRIIEKGNDITGESAYIRVLEYNGYGLLDDKNLEGKLRAPKLVRYEILKGETNIEAAGLLVEIVDFKEKREPVFGKKVIATHAVKGNASHFWDFPVKELVRGIDIDNFEEEEQKPAPTEY